jgi:hypothetical protein
MDRSSVDIDKLAEAGIPSAPAAGDQYDYGADADPDTQEAARLFAEVDKLTLAAERLTAQRKQAEEHAQKLKQAEEQLLNKDIPELLGRMRLDDFTTASGIHVKVKREIKASLPGHERVEARMGALRWLVENGHGGVIKNQVSVALDRGDDTRANELVVDLRAKGFDVEAKKDVNHMTLGALVRELVADGKIVPRDLFNMFDMRIAKLSRK